MKNQNEIEKEFICEKCKKHFIEILRWKFQKKLSYEPKLCENCSNKETLGIMRNLNKGVRKW